jgi:hypothetical protein
MHGASGDSPIRVTASKVRSNEDIERRDSDLEFSDTVEPKDTFRDMTVFSPVSSVFFSARPLQQDY